MTFVKAHLNPTAVTLSDFFVPVRYGFLFMLIEKNRIEG